jgi:transcriptional regulator of arginine metabolism
VLRQLLSSGAAGTQDELREHLEKQGYAVTQSTISRDLRRLGAIKMIDDEGRTVYRFPSDGAVTAPLGRTALGDLIRDIVTNGMIIVVKTTSGSAPLIAAHIDHYRPGGILGTIAGDDTIFIAPASAATIPLTIDAIRKSLLLET